MFALTVQPTCNIVDQIDEGIVIYVQNNVQPDMYEGANGIPLDVYEFITFDESEIEPIEI